MIDVSSFSLVFLNIERYISIVYPIYHHTRITSKKVLTLLPIVWFLGLLEQCFLCSSFESENGACVFGNPAMFQITVITFLILHFFPSRSTCIISVRPHVSKIEKYSELWK